MDGEIPDPDIRVRRRLLWGQNVDALRQTLDTFYGQTGIKVRRDEEDTWLKAILLVQNPQAFWNQSPGHGLGLLQDEAEMLELDREPPKRRQDSTEKPRRLPSLERNHLQKWHKLPWQLWKILILCALGAITQGWSEVAVNGSQQWFQPAFQKFIDVPLGPDDKPLPVDAAPEIVGLINSAPYLCCVLSCWLTPLLNKMLGRRGTIFFSTLFSVAAPILQASAQKWWTLFIFRLLMGIGIGPKSATIPIYLAEVAPAGIRGSLVMLWQVFTAFGIMLGSLAGVALQHLGQASNDVECPIENPSRLLLWTCSMHWRLILGSPFIVPTLLLAYIYTCYESPRWLVARAHLLRLNDRPKAAQQHYQEAYAALEALSRHRMLAAREILWYYFLLHEERKDLSNRMENHPGRIWLVHQLSELFGRRRNRRAIFASSVCMFAQQFCGVNLIVYYSNYAFAKIQLGRQNPSAGDVLSATSEQRFKIDRLALLYSMGFGLINFFFATPAFFMIDTVGRRTLLLCTFPFLAISQIITSVAFAVQSTKVGPGVALAGMYLFGVFYSFGEGPIPFVYAAESMPLYCREVSMAMVVSLNWLMNWIVAFCSPLMLGRMGSAWTFGFYGIWNGIIWFMILFLVPETRLLKLEEVDSVFETIETSAFGAHAWKTLQWQLGSGKKPEPLYKDATEQIHRDREREDAARDSELAPLRGATSIAMEFGNDTLERTFTTQRTQSHSGDTLVHRETV